MPQANKHSSTSKLALPKVSPPVTTKALIGAYRSAVTACADAEEQAAALTKGVIGTFVSMPEFPASHHAGPESLDYGAAQLMKAAGHIPGSAQANRLLVRVSAYKAILSQLRALRDEWEEMSGLDAARAAENSAYERKEHVWKALVGRLKTSPKERPEILRFLAVGPDHGGVLEPWRLRAAFKALSQGGR
jgi:hypothetical protein